jgi:predicted phage terminase large subunit-like protein
MSLSYADRMEILSIDDELLKYATPQELGMYQRALEIETKLSGILAFCTTVTPSFKEYPHIRLIATHLDALIEGRLYYDGPGPTPIRSDEDVEVDEESGEEYFTMIHPTRGDPVVYNLLLHAPPRHGKSFLVSEHLPAYLLIKFPDLKVILAAYEQTFAEGWGEKVRDRIVDSADEFGVTVRSGKNAAKGYFRIKDHAGEMRCAGAGGSITGRGGHTLILDDPISNADDAKSGAVLDSQENWWPSTFYNRRQRWPDGTPGRVLGMWTRWTEDDIRGRIIDKQKDQWCIINLPAIAEVSDDEPVDPLGREDGTPLCRDVMPLRDLKQMREMSPLWFESQYQGRPFIAEGHLIRKPFQHYSIETRSDGKETYVLRFLDGKVLHVLEEETIRFGALDLAASQRTTADWTVLGAYVITKTNPRYLLVRDVVRARVSTEEHAPFLIRESKRMRLGYTLIEKQTYGTNLIGIMQRQNKVRVRPVSADKDKYTRVNGTVVPALAMKQLFFPEIGSAAWYPEFEKEVLRFPNATHDDQVDVLAYACQEFFNLPSYIKREEDLSGVQGKIQRKMRDLRKPSKQRHPDLGKGRW